jgi:putative peptidoglycan lipid II flippase
MKYMGVQGLALAGSIGGWVLFIFTVKEVGGEEFTKMLKSMKSIYFIVSMLIFSIILYWINGILIEVIRN